MVVESFEKAKREGKISLKNFSQVMASRVEMDSS
jgi:hypothetical protein